jgi:hypothetical protein
LWLWDLHGALEDVYRKAGYVECHVIEIEVDGKGVLLVNEGDLCGCVYSVEINETTGHNTFLGRIRPDKTIDSDAPQVGLGVSGPLIHQQESGEGGSSKCPSWAAEGDEEGWQQETVLMQKVMFARVFCFICFLEAARVFYVM